MFYFDINEDFDSNTFLTEPTINFGNHTNSFDEFGNKGGRCVMLIALRLLCYLGFKRIFLLGCDFKMDVHKPYAFAQGKHQGGVNTNNDKFIIINERLTALAPKFKQAGVDVFNCSRNSELKAFPFLEFQEAVNLVTKHYNTNPDLSNLYGNS